MSTQPRITFLIGHKGVGRTTLLRRLAESEIPLWGRPTRYVDLDEEIQRQAVMTLEMIVEAEGEAGLAERERRVLDALQSEERALCVSLGSSFSSWSHPALGSSQALFVWVRRLSDSVGRIFLNRPRVNRAIPPLQEYEERARFRSSRFSRLAGAEFWLREEATSFSLDELAFLERPPILSLERLLPDGARANAQPLSGSRLADLLSDRPRHPIRGAVLASDALEAERIATPLQVFCARRSERLLEVPLAPEDAEAALAALPRMGVRWAVLGDRIRSAALALARAQVPGILTQRASRVGMVDLLVWDADGKLRSADCCSVPGVRLVLREWARRAGLAQPRQSGDMAIWGDGSLVAVVRDEVPQALPPGAPVVGFEDEDEESAPPYPRVLISVGGRAAFREAGSPMPPEEWSLDWLIDTEAGWESPGREISQFRGARYLGGELLHKEFCLEVQRTIAGLDHF